LLERKIGGKKQNRLSPKHRLMYTFNTANSTPNDIKVAGKKDLVELENGNPKEQLNSLYHKYFCD